MSVATKKQLDYIKKLGGIPVKDMTGSQASKMIRDLINNGAKLETKEVKEKETKEKPVKKTNVASETKKQDIVEIYKQNSLSKIKDYLENNKDKLGKSLDNKDKTLEKCYRYIENEVRSKATSGFVMATDEDIYNLVDTYYLEYQEIEDKPLENVSSSTDKVIKLPTIQANTNKYKPNTTQLNMFDEFGDIF